MMFFCTWCFMSRLSRLSSLSLSLCLSVSSLCFCEKKKTNRTSTNLRKRHFTKTHLDTTLEHGGFHGETTTTFALKTTTTTLATMRLSRASRGRRARAFDGRFRKCAPSAALIFFFSVSIQARDGLEGGNERWSPLSLGGGN